MSLNINAQEKNNNLPNITSYSLLSKLVKALEIKKNEIAFRRENVPVSKAFDTVVKDKEDRRDWKTANRYRQVLNTFQEFLETKRVLYTPLRMVICFGGGQVILKKNVDAETHP